MYGGKERGYNVGDFVRGGGAVGLWNTPPDDVASASSLPVFRRKLKDYFDNHSRTLGL